MMLKREGRVITNPTLYKSERFTNRFLYEVLPDNSWKGKPCYIIGGGPSLKGFDWNRLKGKRTIGINLAFQAIEPSIIFSMDTRFLRWIESGTYGEETRMKFYKVSSYRVWNCTYVASLPKDIFIIPVFKNYNAGLQAFTFSLKDGIGHGNNSGYGALNLAVCLGANPIFLLGIDCKHQNGKTHWHKGHPAPQKEATVLKFITFFERAAPVIKHKGFRVINLNPDSGLNCFEKSPPDKYL